MSLTDLPVEILQEIMAQHFGPCCLRRHIVAQLAQMHLMNTMQSDPQHGRQYTSHAHDSDVRKRIRYDPPERAYYAARRGGLQLISRATEHSRLLAERDWLRKPPMDYQAFEHLVSNPLDPRYADLEDIVIELFPETDFFDPPATIANIDAQDRQSLVQRLPPHFAPNVTVHLMTLDMRIYDGLTALWLAAIPRMPPQVNSVTVIAKDVIIPGKFTSMNGLNNDQLGNISAAMALLKEHGKIGKSRFLLTVNAIL